MFATRAVSTLIIGAGPIGLASAYELARNGENVTVLSQNYFAGEASHVNAGWIVPIMSAPVPAPGALKKSIHWLIDPKSPLKISPELNFRHITFMLSMLQFSTKKNFLHGFNALSEFGRGTLEAFDDYLKDEIDFEIHRTGVLMLFKSQKELDAHAIEFKNVEQYGLKPVEFLTSSELKKREPLLSNQVKFGIDCTDQYFVNPTSLITGLRKKCETLGVNFVESDSQIKLISKNLTVGIRIASQSLSAENILIAAGVGSRALLEDLGRYIPLRFGKGYSFSFPSEKRIKNSLYLSEAKVAVTPTDDFLRFAGTMEFGGNGLTVSQQRAQGILDSSASYFTENLVKNSEPKLGLRPMTPDGLPIIGAVPGFKNLYIASGHAMQGLTLAPNTAKAITQIIINKTIPATLKNFSPIRFCR